MSDLQDIIATTSIKAFNQGVAHGARHELERFLEAAKAVSFDTDRFGPVVTLEDLKQAIDNPHNGRNAT